MNAKNRIRQINLLIMVSILAACGGAKDPATIKVIFLPYLSNAPFFIAQEEGFFEEQGLIIELVEMGRSSEAIPALEKGDVDVVGGALSAGLLNAISRGANIKITADKGQIAPSGGCPTAALIASNSFMESHPTMSLADLKGASIGINPAGFSAYWTELYLTQANLSLDDVDIFKGESPAKFEAIREGTLDIMGANEPWLTRVLQAGYGSIFLKAMDIIPEASYASVWYGSTLLDENSDLGNRFMAAYLQGVRQYNEGKIDRNLEILVKYTDLEKELIRDSCWVSINNDGKINASDIIDFQEWAIEKDLLDEIVPEDMFWDPSFIDFAVKQIGESK
jgi:NitT/TauT family transport system substrate-binding protein